MVPVHGDICIFEKYKDQSSESQKLKYKMQLKKMVKGERIPVEGSCWDVGVPKDIT
jgi:hypothetical protein